MMLLLGVGMYSPCSGSGCESESVAEGETGEQDLVVSFE